MGDNSDITVSIKPSHKVQIIWKNLKIMLFKNVIFKYIKNCSCINCTRKREIIKINKNYFVSLKTNKILPINESNRIMPVIAEPITTVQLTQIYNENKKGFGRSNRVMPGETLLTMEGNERINQIENKRWYDKSINLSIKKF